jgi:hypothetical protein
MKVALVQFDGKFPNLALMRISSHHKKMGDEVVLFDGIGNIKALDKDFSSFDEIYGSLLFDWSKPVAEELKKRYPRIILGGTGWYVIPNLPGTQSLVSIQARKAAADVSSLEQWGIHTNQKDYSIYPRFEASIGFTQRGCRMGCGFCKVPVTEGRVRPDQSVTEIWRGGSHPKNLILWDNDTFGNKEWRKTFREISDGGFKVSFNQGINARLMDEENAEALASAPCYDDQFKVRQWYTAWDNRNDEEVLFRGLRRLVRYGVNPDRIMVYMLIGYWEGETSEDREYRRIKLRDFGCRPYPMPFRRPIHRGCKLPCCAEAKELVGFQRWVVPAYDKRVPWKDWVANGYRPEGIAMAECRTCRRTIYGEQDECPSCWSMVEGAA